MQHDNVSIACKSMQITCAICTLLCKAQCTPVGDWSQKMATSESQPTAIQHSIFATGCCSAVWAKVLPWSCRCIVLHEALHCKSTPGAHKILKKSAEADAHKAQAQAQADLNEQAYRQAMRQYCVRQLQSGRSCTTMGAKGIRQKTVESMAMASPVPYSL